MAQADPNNEAMKQALKEAFAEVLVALALPRVVREGQQIDRVERDEVFNVL